MKIITYTALLSILSLLSIPVSALEIELPENTTRHHLEIDTMESVLIKIKTDAILTGYIKANGDISIKYEGDNKEGSSLRFDPTLNISRRDSELYVGLRVNDFGDTYFQTPIPGSVSVNAAPGARVEISQPVTGGLNVVIPSRDNHIPSETEGLFILGGASFYGGSLNAFLDQGTFYVAGGVTIDSNTFTARTLNRIHIESKVNANFSFSLSGADITLHEVYQDNIFNPAQMTPGSFYISGKTVSLYGDVSSNVAYMGINGDKTINFYGRTINGTHINLRSDTLNAYGGLISGSCVYIDSDNFNDFGLDIYESSEWGC